MHNAAFAALGLDWAYVPLPVPPERVGDAVRGLAALGFAGANVTVPHKQAVMPFLDELTPVARAVGAVNTIVVRPDGSLLGDNTDGAGFMADLWAHGVRVGEEHGERIRGWPEDPHPVSSLLPSPCPRVTGPRPRRGRRRRGRWSTHWLKPARRSRLQIARWTGRRSFARRIGAALEATAETQSAQRDSGCLSDLRVSAVLPSRAVLAG